MRTAGRSDRAVETIETLVDRIRLQPINDRLLFSFELKCSEAVLATDEL